MFFLNSFFRCSFSCFSRGQISRFKQNLNLIFSSLAFLVFIGLFMSVFELFSRRFELAVLHFYTYASTGRLGMGRKSESRAQARLSILLGEHFHGNFGFSQPHQLCWRPSYKYLTIVPRTGKTDAISSREVSLQSTKTSARIDVDKRVQSTMMCNVCIIQGKRLS